MTYVPADYNVGFWGNSSVIFYSPKIDDHPTVVAGDAVASNFLYCSNFDLYPEYQSETGEYIRGFPDRTVFEVSPIRIKGNIQQKMLARLDNSPDYVLIRLFEHCRHAWSGYAYSGPADGSGVEGLAGSTFTPQFSIFSDQLGVFSECMVDSIEFIAESNEQITVNYGIVAKKLWTEDMPNVRNLLTGIATASDVNMPMRQVFSQDCAIESGNTEGEPVNKTFALTSSGDSPFLQGYNFADNPRNEKLIKVSLKLENFLDPVFTMQSHERWLDRTARDNGINTRITENLWARSFVPLKPRQLSAEFTWITDVVPIDIVQRIAGAATNQMMLNGSTVMGQSMLFYFGPIVIFVRNPIWSLGKPEMLPNQLYKIDVQMLAASDAELVAQPTKSWL